MQIRSTLPRFTKPLAQRSKPKQNEEVPIPFKERAVASAIVGASLGTMAGEKLGEFGFIGGTAYAGYVVGGLFGNPEIGKIVGGIAGAGIGYLMEDKLNIGKTIGGAAGFISGGIIGGITGTVIAGTSAILNADLFQQS